MNNTIEEYIVNRIKQLESRESMLEAANAELKSQLAKVETMKELMRDYFKLKRYDTSRLYIDHSYDNTHIEEIAEFIGLTEGEEDV